MELELISRQPAGPARPAPILFVHGAWHAAWCWDEHFLPYFADHGYATYALSLRGHGNSQGTTRGALIRHYVDDVAQVAARLPALPIIVGHSMGGMVVQKYLETHRAEAAVLLASIPVRGPLRLFVDLARRYPIDFLMCALQLRMYPLVRTPAQVRDLFFSPDLPADQLAEYTPRIGDESFAAALDLLLPALPHPDRVSTPMLVFGGSRDTIFTPAEAAVTARAYHTAAIMIPGMAHDMMLEAGWQDVADRILDWLAQREQKASPRPAERKTAADGSAVVDRSPTAPA